MDAIVSKISFDLVHPGVKPVVYAVQGESNVRKVELSLYCGSESWNVPEDTVVTVRYRKSDYTGGYYDKLPDGTAACSYRDNVITMVLAPQMLTSAGSVLAQAELQQGEQLLSTFSFRIMVEPNPAAGILQSETYVNWLT